MIMLTNCDSILKCSIIEQIGWELTKDWMHTVLDLQSDGSDAQYNKPLKQGLGQSSTGKGMNKQNIKQKTKGQENKHSNTFMETNVKTTQLIFHNHHPL